MKIPDDLAGASVDAIRRAIAQERAAAKLRREGRLEEAADAYDEASTQYAETGLAFHERGESDFAIAVRAAIRRCQTTADNIRHPKERRAPATTPRPCCLACDKPLRRYRHDGRKFRDGTPREWGAYGDNRFCGLTCGWQYACRVTSGKR